MFDLQARIHLKKIEILVSADDKFNCASRPVIHGTGQFHRLLAHGCARFRRNEGAGGLFHHLLMTTLNGTFTLASIDDVAVLVGNQLDFDMARLRDKFFNENPRITKGCLRLAHRGPHPVCKISSAFDHPHALSAEAAGPICTASSAICMCGVPASASE